MNTLAAVTLDLDSAAHLAVALKVHRTNLDRRHLILPPALLQLEKMAAGMVRTGHEATGADSRRGVGDDGRDGLWIAPADAASEVGVSLRTVQRWMDGPLRSTKVGRVRRVHRDDLEAFMRERSHG